MNVLIATDGSDPALDACRLARRLLVPGRDHIRLLTILSYDRYPTSLVPGEHVPGEGAASVAVHEEVGRATGAGRRVLEEAGFSPDVWHRFGNPADEIAAEIDDWQPDLVVLGRRGVRGLERVLGSVSEHVLRRAHKAAVLIAP